MISQQFQDKAQEQLTAVKSWQVVELVKKSEYWSWSTKSRFWDTKLSKAHRARSDMMAVYMLYHIFTESAAKSKYCPILP